MKRRVHSREFKLEVARQVANGEKRPAQICREHNLANSVLDRWRKECEQRGEAAFTERELTEGSSKNGDDMVLPQARCCSSDRGSRLLASKKRPWGV